MSNYFENFPTINYQGRNVRDITRRNKFFKSVTTNPLLFLPYTVKEGERAEDIAYRYYGSTDYTWLVYLANNIVDPYHQWPLDEENFNKYLIQKYEARSLKTGYEVLDWAQNQTIDSNIIYYYKEV
jgi:hypothetical protein